jgi:hypothetical protein
MFTRSPFSEKLPAMMSAGDAGGTAALAVTHKLIAASSAFATALVFTHDALIALLSEPKLSFTARYLLLRPNSDRKNDSRCSRSSNTQQQVCVTRCPRRRSLLNPVVIADATENLAMNFAEQSPHLGAISRRFRSTQSTRRGSIE